MSLTADEQELFDFAVAALPTAFVTNDREREELAGFAKMAGAVKSVAAHWLDMAALSTATGPDSVDPDWLDLHANDRGTRRAAGETDAALIARLREVPDGLTRTTLLAAIQAMVDASGVTGDVAMLEMPRDQAHSGSYTNAYGTNDDFYSLGGGVMRFSPYPPGDDSPWSCPPYVEGIAGLVKRTVITFFYCTSPANDGDYEITGLWDVSVGLAGVTYTNAAGVAGGAEYGQWIVNRINVRNAPLGGFARAHSGRGYRSWNGASAGTTLRASPCGIIVILPYGTTEATRLAVRELVRQKKAAGFRAMVERRTIP